MNNKKEKRIRNVWVRKDEISQAKDPCNTDKKCMIDKMGQMPKHDNTLVQIKEHLDS